MAGCTILRSGIRTQRCHYYLPVQGESRIMILGSPLSGKLKAGCPCPVWTPCEPSARTDNQLTVFPNLGPTQDSGISLVPALKLRRSLEPAWVRYCPAKHSTQDAMKTSHRNITCLLWNIFVTGCLLVCAINSLNMAGLLFRVWLSGYLHFTCNICQRPKMEVLFHHGSGSCYTNTVKR